VHGYIHDCDQMQGNRLLIPVLKETEGVHKGYYREQRDLLEQTNLTVKMNNESYLKSMDVRKSNQRKLDSLRQFQVDDKVTRYQVTGNKTIDKLSQLQTGPYTVTALDESGVDCLIQIIGSSQQPVRCHVDPLRLFRTFQTDTTDEPAAAAAPSETEYKVERIMGERKHSARQGGGTSYLVEWSDSSGGTEHKCSWEPEQNLTHCPQLIKEWFELGLTEQKNRLEDAKQIGIMSLQLLERKLSPNESLVITDLSQSEYCYKGKP
jgi:hypothetical protein